MNRYYITVRAHAVSGATADATSNGIQVGYGHMIIPGTITAPRYQSDNTSTVMSTDWSSHQSTASPIYSVDGALGYEIDHHILFSFQHQSESNVVRHCMRRQAQSSAVRGSAQW